jgi:hypothetical protein
MPSVEDAVKVDPKGSTALSVTLPETKLDFPAAACQAADLKSTPSEVGMANADAAPPIIAIAKHSIVLFIFLSCRVNWLLWPHSLKAIDVPTNALHALPVCHIQCK